MGIIIKKSALKKKPTRELKEIYNKNTDTTYSATTIKEAGNILQKRGVDEAKKSVEENTEGNEDNIVSVKDKLDKLIEKVDQDEDKKQWKYKIVSGPVLARQDKLEEKLDSLGEDGWELVNTQRHSIMAKQHAVCFLKKKI